MAEDVDTETQVAVDEASGKGGRKKLFIIAGAAALVLILAGGAAYFFLFAGKSEADALMAQVKPTYFYPLPSMTVNLSGGQAEFLKISVALELSNEQMVQIIEPRMARVIDAFQVYLRELRRSDLEGSAGIYRLKEELRRRVNLAIHPAQVESILFKEILVQ